MKKKQGISPVQFLLVLMGIIAWGIAVYFASQETAKAVEKGGAIAMALNNVAVGGALGSRLLVVSAFWRSVLVAG